MSNLITIDEAINEISLSWRKTTEAIIHTAMVLKKYQLDDNWAQIQSKLDSENIIKISVQKFLLGIGSNPVLIKSENYQKLPPHYNTLYHLSTIKVDKLEKLITDETVNVSTDLSDAKDLALKYSGKKKKNNILNKSSKVIFTISFNSPRGVKNKVSNVFDRLIDEFGEEAVKMKIEI
jgi:hypothetical protein